MTATLKDLSERMKDIDFAMLATHTKSGAIGSRPMSNNREVDYDGSSWFFATEDTLMIADIESNPKVNLSYQGKSGIIGQRPFFIAIEGHAVLERDTSKFADHWTSGLDRWWPDGIDTPGLVLIHIRGERAHYWDGQDESELLIHPVPSP